MMIVIQVIQQAIY